MTIIRHLLAVGACALAASLAHGGEPNVPTHSKFADAELQKIRDGFDARRDAEFKALAGKPFAAAKKRPPLGPGRGDYVRGYCYSVTDFAMRSMWLGEQLDAANAALLEMCRYYLDHPVERDDSDNFYWSADVTCRLVEFFGRNGSRAPGRLHGDVEDVVREMMWIWARKHSAVADAETQQSKTWTVTGSENHHLQRFSTAWQFAKFLSGDASYRHRAYDDGKTAGEHYAAWTAYAKEYLRQRAKKGLFVEIASTGYNFVSLKGIYNFRDFADDPALKKRAGQFLDLYWATWAQEQLDAVRGGGKTRVYAGRNSAEAFLDKVSRMAWYYLGLGRKSPPHDNDYTFLTSGYRMPLVVMDIALDPAGRGVCEIKQHPLGAAEEGFNAPPAYGLRTDSGEICRYSYCTPDFILGTLMFDARPPEYWTSISSQNRWQGAIFAGASDARVFPQCRTLARNRSYNAFWSVQSKGTLITQKLKASKGAGEMRVWFSTAGLTDRVEKGDWVFVQAKGAYAAVRAVAGGYEWKPSDNEGPGEWMTCRDGYSPVILEVARKSDFADYAAFQHRVLGNPLKFQGGVLAYKGLCGDELTFHADYSQPPKINGAAVKYSPGKAFDSPFVQSDWDSGVVTVRKGDRKLVLDFNADN